MFRNGDALFRGVRVLLPRRVMSSWEQVHAGIVSAVYVHDDHTIGVRDSYNKSRAIYTSQEAVYSRWSDAAHYSRH